LSNASIRAATMRIFLNRLFGRAVGVFAVFFILVSLPLNVIAIMRIMELKWYFSLLSVLVFCCIPIVGQIGYIALAFTGVYCLWQAIMG
jgi:hypothetical protein